MYISSLINKLLELKDMTGDIEVKIEDEDFWVTDMEYAEIVDNKDNNKYICLFAHKKYLPPEK